MWLLLILLLLFFLFLFSYIRNTIRRQTNAQNPCYKSNNPNNSAKYALPLILVQNPYAYLSPHFYDVQDYLDKFATPQPLALSFVSTQILPKSFWDLEKYNWNEKKCFRQETLKMKEREGETTEKIDKKACKDNAISPIVIFDSRIKEAHFVSDCNETL